MKRTIKVFLGEEASRVGTLHYDAVGSRERAAFSNADAWLVSSDRFALEPALGMTNQELDQFADAFEHPQREAARKAIRRP